jgi:hypothetical protein
MIRIIDAASGEVLREFQAGAARVNALDFSPDGTLLASAGLDGAILVWRIAKPEKSGPPSAPDPDAAWNDLRKVTGPAAASAWGTFAAGLCSELARRLEAETSPPEAASWIRQLDADDASVRKSARERLDDAGVIVEEALTKALDAANPEAAAAIRELLGQLRATIVRSAGSLRRLRALEILEADSSPSSMEAIARIAQGSASSVERGWAAACLRRRGR